MDKVRETILARLAEGESLVSICKSEGLPTARTVQNWMREDEGFASQVTHAREEGYHARALRAIEEVGRATDASLGRLKFDAERWYLGKLSNAFSDNKAQKHEVGGSGGGPINISVKFD